LDFATRIKQLQDIRKTKDLGRSNIWVGGLFIPEAYITATRQSAAQANTWSLENLELHVEILQDNKGETDEASFISKDFCLEGGAVWDPKGKCLALSNDISTKLPPAKFLWKLRTEEKKEGNKVTLPVYLNETRSEFLFAVDVNAPTDILNHVWTQRGVALTVWKSTI